MPSVVATIVGLIVLLDFFVAQEELNAVGAALLQWTMIVATFALLLGILNVLSFHLRKIKGRGEGWPYSIALVGMMLILWGLGVAPGSKGTASPSVSWLFENVYIPLQATIFSLLAFFVVSAAYRAFRARSLEATLFLLAGLIVLLGQAPLGHRLWEHLPALKDWVLGVPSVAGARGIILGVALGTILTGLRLLLGFDRARYFK